MTGNGVDYGDIQERSLDEVTKPPLIPAGPWMLKGVGMLFKTKSATDDETGEEHKFTQITYRYTPVQALPGVDPEDVEAGEWKGQVVPLWRNVSNPTEEFNQKAFVEKHGVATSGRSWKQIAEAFRGSTILANVEQGTRDDKVTGEVTPVNYLSNFKSVSGN